MCPPPPQASSRTGCRSPDFGLLHWMVWSDVTINSRETSGPLSSQHRLGKERSHRVGWKGHCGKIKLVSSHT